MLLNLVPSTLYDYIAGCSMCNNAIAVLKNLYIKTMKFLEAQQSIDQLSRDLKQISKECNSKAVSAVLYCDKYIRNAFISGLTSNLIRQCLLGDKELILLNANHQASSLEAAQKNSELYSHSLSPVAATTNNDEKLVGNLSALTLTKYSIKT